MYFGLAYFLSCFTTCMGVLQIASLSPRSKYLRLFKSSYLRKTLGIVLIVISIPLFFLTDDRVVSDHSGGLDANQQAIIFAFTALFSYLLTAIISQLIWKTKIDNSLLKPFYSEICKNGSGDFNFTKLQVKNWADFRHWITGYFRP